MYDRIRFYKYLNQEEYQYLLKALKWTKRHDTMSGTAVYTYKRIPKFFLKLYHGRLQITGNFHSFLCGNNSGRFTRSDFIRAIDMLSNELNLSLDDAEVIWFEAGPNVILPYNPERIINAVSGFKPKGYKTFAPDHDDNTLRINKVIKMYDKTACMLDRFRSHIDLYIFRFEPFFKRLKHKPHLRTLDRLMSEESFRIVRDMVLKEYDKVIFEPIINGDIDTLNPSSKSQELLRLIGRIGLVRARLFNKKTLSPKKYEYVCKLLGKLYDDGILCEPEEKHVLRVLIKEELDRLV